MGVTPVDENGRLTGGRRTKCNSFATECLQKMQKH
jgi:hypothetical protein